MLNHKSVSCTSVIKIIMRRQQRVKSLAIFIDSGAGGGEGAGSDGGDGAEGSDGGAGGAGGGGGTGAGSSGGGGSLTCSNHKDCGLLGYCQYGLCMCQLGAVRNPNGACVWDLGQLILFARFYSIAPVVCGLVIGSFRLRPRSKMISILAKT